MASLYFTPFSICLFYLSVCDGSTNTTITSAGSFIGKAGDFVSVYCTFPNLGGENVFEYNGMDSDRLNAMKGTENTVTVTTNSSALTVKTVALGLRSSPSGTGIVAQLNFTLTADHNGSTLRCKFLSSGSLDDSSESNFIKLTVLYPPCCNASSPVSVNHNITDPDPFLLLNCTEIVGSRGNLPAIVEWTVSPSNPKCTGKTPECCDELYNISSIGRECNGVTIKCMAKNEAGFTRKVFNLAVKCFPEKPKRCHSTFIDRNQGAWFEWNKSEDDGGFALKSYNLTLSVNGVVSRIVSLKENKHGFSFPEGKDNDTVQFSVSAGNALGMGPECLSILHIPIRGCTKSFLKERTWRTLTIDCDSVPGYTPQTSFVVYYSKKDSAVTSKVYTNSLPATLSALAEDTSYEIVVEARNSAGALENSTSTMFRTYSSGLPGIIDSTKVNVAAKSSLSFTIEFPSVEDPGRENATITHYLVHLLTQFHAQKEVTQTFEVSNLKANTTYGVAVSAINNFGEEGQHSDSIKIITERSNETNSGISTGTLVGAIIGSLLAGAIVGVIITVLIMKRCRGEGQGKEASCNVELKDSRIYAQSSKLKKTDASYEDVH